MSAEDQYRGHPIQVILVAMVWVPVALYNLISTPDYSSWPLSSHPGMVPFSRISGVLISAVLIGFIVHHYTKRAALRDLEPASLEGMYRRAEKLRSSLPPDLANQVIAKLEVPARLKAVDGFHEKLLQDITEAIKQDFKLEALVHYKVCVEDPAKALGDYLKKFEPTDLPRAIAKVLKDALDWLDKSLPAFVQQRGAMKAPCYALISTASIGHFYKSFKTDSRLLWATYLGYLRRFYSAQKLIEEHKLKQDSLEHSLDICGEFSCLLAWTARMPIAMPHALRFEGTWIVAPSGRGKTTLLSNLLVADFHEVMERKASVIIMDSKGELSNYLRRFQGFAPGERMEDQLCLIEPHADLALNPLDLGATSSHTISLMEYLFSALLDTKITSLQSTLFRSVLIAIKVIPGANFDTFRAILRDGWKPVLGRYIDRLHPDDAEFFVKGEFDSKTYKETREQLLWRIRDLTTKVPLLRDMLKAPRTRIDIGKEMDAGKVIIIDNSRAILTDEGSEFFSRFFIALIRGAAVQRSQRPDDLKLPCYVYIDECQTVIANDPNVTKIMDECRSQKIGLVLAHQRVQQISNEVLGALSNCAVKIANSDDDAKAMAEPLRTDAETLRTLPKGEFVAFMRDMTRSGIRVSVRNLPAKDWPRMSEEEFHRVREVMQDRYGRQQAEPYQPPPQSSEPTWLKLKKPNPFETWPGEKG